MSVPDIADRPKLKPWPKYAGPTPNIDRIAKLGMFFTAFLRAVREAEQPAEEFQAELPFIAETIRKNVLGANPCRRALRRIADETGITRDRGAEWVEGRITRTVGPWP